MKPFLFAFLFAASMLYAAASMSVFVEPKGVPKAEFRSGTNAVFNSAIAASKSYSDTNTLVRSKAYTDSIASPLRLRDWLGPLKVRSNAEESGYKELISTFSTPCTFDRTLSPTSQQKIQLKTSTAYYIAISDFHVYKLPAAPSDCYYMYPTETTELSFTAEQTGIIPFYNSGQVFTFSFSSTPTDTSYYLVIFTVYPLGAPPSYLVSGYTPSARICSFFFKYVPAAQ